MPCHDLALSHFAFPLSTLPMPQSQSAYHEEIMKPIFPQPAQHHNKHYLLGLKKPTTTPDQHYQTFSNGSITTVDTSEEASPEDPPPPFKYISFVMTP
jgi:hypothetical protein